MLLHWVTWRTIVRVLGAPICWAFSSSFYDGPSRWVKFWYWWNGPCQATSCSWENISILRSTFIIHAMQKCVCFCFLIFLFLILQRRRCIYTHTIWKEILNVLSSFLIAILLPSVANRFRTYFNHPVWLASDECYHLLMLSRKLACVYVRYVALLTLTGKDFDIWRRVRTPFTP